jgi:hypothetical protein
MVKKMTNKETLEAISLSCRKILKVLSFILLAGLLSSCKDFIDPAAANSLSAIIAVVGEYLYAILALVLVVLLWILRPAGIALAVLGVLGLYNLVELSQNSALLICIGLLMFIASFAPIKQYEPLVVISKHFKLQKKMEAKEKRKCYQEFLIQLLVGFLTLVIEYSIFAK